MLYSLARASALPEPVNDDVGIGSGKVLRFRDMLTTYAQAAGLRPRRVWNWTHC